MLNGSPPTRGESFTALAALLHGDVDAIAAMPSDRLPGLHAELAALHSRLAAIEHALAARMLAAQEPGPQGDHLLDVREAAERLGMSADWLYRHAKRLPFTRRVGRRALKFDADGLARWVARHRRA